MSKHRSLYPGVSWHSGSKKWRAQIRNPSNTLLHLGVFDTEEEAFNRYNEFRVKFGRSKAVKRSAYYVLPQ